MALRAIHAMQGILSDVEDVCPKARIFNYTNPVNVLAQAVTTHSRRAVRLALRGPDLLRRPDRDGPAGSSATSSTR